MEPIKLGGFVLCIGCNKYYLLVVETINRIVSIDIIIAGIYNIITISSIISSTHTTTIINNIREEYLEQKNKFTNLSVIYYMRIPGRKATFPVPVNPFFKALESAHDEFV